MSYLSSGNQKYKKRYGHQLVTFGLPAYRSGTGKLVCLGAGKCKQGCYAQQGRYVMPKIKAAQEKRLALSMRPTFVPTIDAELERKHPEYVRLHDSGDFYSARYLRNWLEIIRRFSNIVFFAYTKAIPLFRMQDGLPGNFLLTYSEGGRWDGMIDRKDRFSRVFSDEASLKAAGFVDGSEDDLRAILKGARRIGLVYHGWRSREFVTGDNT